MKVNELHRILAEHVAAGRGEDDVYLALYDGHEDSSRAISVERYDWVLTDVDTRIGPADAFVALVGEVETCRQR